MKKRKILVGLALAAASLFSLAACGGTDNPNPTTASSVVTTPSQTSTPTATTPSEEKVNVKFMAKYSDGAESEELTSLAKEIKKGSKIAEPTDPEKAGYNFLGFETGTGAPFNFDTEINSATTIYAYFDKVVTAYETIAESTNNYLAYDFNDTDAETDLEETFPLISDESVGTGSMVFENHKLKLVNTAKTGDQKNDAHATIVFDEALKNSVVKCTVSLASSNIATINFIHFYEVGEGQEGGKYEIGATSKGLRYNGSEDENTPIESEKEYVYYFEIDLLNKKITLTVDGNETPVKNTSINFSQLKRIDFGSTKGADGFVTLDNIAVSIEAAPIDDAKPVAKAELATLYTGYETSDKIEGIPDTVWNVVSSAKTAGDEAIDAATTFDELETALNTAKENINLQIGALRSNYTVSAKNLVSTWTWSDDTTASENYNAGTPTEKDGYDTELATLKAKYVKAGETKVAITEGVFDAAKSVLFVKNDSGELVEVAADAEYSATTDYYVNFALAYNKEGETEYTSVPVTLKDLDLLCKNFVTEAKAIVKEKVDVTVKYYARSMVEATGITEFASGVTYYTEASGIYTAVATDETFDSAKTYYTYSPLEVTGSSKTIKVIKNESMSKTDLPELDGKVIINSYADSSLSTEFDYTTTFSDSTQIIYVLVGTRTSFIYYNDIEGNNESDKTKYATDATKIALDSYITYSVKNNATIKSSSEAVTIEGQSVTKYLDSNGKADANKGWFEINLANAYGTAIINYYVTSSEATARTIALRVDSGTDISGSSYNIAEDTKVVAYANTAANKTDILDFTATVQAGSKYYLLNNNKIYIYGISVVLY